MRAANEDLTVVRQLHFGAGQRATHGPWPDAVDRRGSAPAGIIGALVESGEPVLVIAADAILRLARR